jgi:hypothetical protein
MKGGQRFAFMLLMAGCAGPPRLRPWATPEARNACPKASPPFVIAGPDAPNQPDLLRCHKLAFALGCKGNTAFEADLLASGEVSRVAFRTKTDEGLASCLEGAVRETRYLAARNCSGSPAEGTVRGAFEWYPEGAGGRLGNVKMALPMLRGECDPRYRAPDPK